MSTPGGIPAPNVTLKVRVNRQRCQGHARCAALAPELFKVDELGEGHAIDDGVVSPDQYDRAHLAMTNCPESAISIVER